MDRKTPAVQLVVHPEEFFKQLVCDGLKELKFKVQPETEMYLVKLLQQFITTDQLYYKDAQGNVRSEPLSVVTLEAQEIPSPEKQSSLFKYVGDMALYLAGYFQESLKRKLVDVDYYIDLGGAAYRAVAQRQPAKPMKNVFAELSEKFPKFVDVLNEISEKTTPVRDEKDILRLYDVWLSTQSDRAEKVLMKAGIIPNSTLKKNLQ